MSIFHMVTISIAIISDTEQNIMYSLFSSDELDFKKDEKIVKMFWHWCQNKKQQKAYVYIRGPLNDIWKLEKYNIIIQ